MTKTVFEVRELCMIGIFTALTCVLSPIAIPIPLTPVLMTLGWFAVFISGMLLKPKCAVSAQICYLLLGCAGMPVFSGFQGGFGKLLGPTGGYLMAYPFMAGIISLVLNRTVTICQEDKAAKAFLYAKAAAVLIGSMALCYLSGTIWLSHLSGNSFWQALALAVLPFIAVDSVKVLLCLVAIIPVRERLIRSYLLQ